MRLSGTAHQVQSTVPLSYGPQGKGAFYWPIALISHGRGRGPSSRRGTCRRSTSHGAAAEGPHNSCSGRRPQHMGSSKNTLAAGIQFAAIGGTPRPPSGEHRSTANIVIERGRHGSNEGRARSACNQRRSSRVAHIAAKICAASGEVESWRSARGETSARQSRPQRRIDHWRPYLSPGSCASPNLPRMKKRLSSGGDGWLKPQGPAPRERLPVLVLHYLEAKASPSSRRVHGGGNGASRRIWPSLTAQEADRKFHRYAAVRRQ